MGFLFIFTLMVIYDQKCIFNISSVFLRSSRAGRMRDRAFRAREDRALVGRMGGLSCLTF